MGSTSAKHHFFVREKMGGGSVAPSAIRNNPYHFRSTPHSQQDDGNESTGHEYVTLHR